MNFRYLKYTLFVHIYGLLKIPLVLFVSPRVVEVSPEKFVIKIPLKRRNKNHLNSMYFGALAIGAELSVAAAAVFSITESKQKIDFVFKDFKAEFLKRADGPVYFICEEVATVNLLIEESKKTPDRVERKMKGYAIVPSKSQTEPVMTYELTLSVKNRSRR